MTTEDAVERVRAWANIIERRAPDGDDSVLVDANTADQHAADLRALLAEREAWSWFGEHTNLELSHGCDDPEDDGCWRVHSVNGGVNDREWTLRGTGATPLRAIEAARAVLKGAPHER